MIVASNAPPLVRSDSVGLVRGPKFLQAAAAGIIRIPPDVVKGGDCEVKAARYGLDGIYRDPLPQLRHTPVLKDGHTWTLTPAAAAEEALRPPMGSSYWDYMFGAEASPKKSLVADAPQGSSATSSLEPASGGPKAPPPKSDLERSLKTGDVVKVRDKESEAWKTGKVTSTDPVIKVQPDGWNASARWKFVERPDPAAGIGFVPPSGGGSGSRQPSRQEPAETGPPDFGRGDGRAAEQYEGSTGGRKAFSWIRFDNTEPARASRREIRNLTRRAVAAGGYVSNGKKVELVHISSMLDNTRTLAPSLGNLDMTSGNASSSMATRISKPKGVVLDVAMELNKRYRGRVGIVSAASTYHCGGGFRTGGRHALEEAICVQTPLYESICKVREGLLGPGCHDSQDEYIPMDGVILSPDIEVFRGGSDEGYPFFERPVPLAAVISVAMFNCNPDVNDAPLDCPDDTDVYEELLRGKFRSVLAAAVEAKCQALVMPDVGCGVYKNDPETVGMVFGQVLKEEFWGKIKEVALTGMASFQNTVEEVTNEESESELETREDKDNAAFRKLVSSASSMSIDSGSSSQSQSKRRPAPAPPRSSPPPAAERRSPSPGPAPRLSPPPDRQQHGRSPSASPRPSQEAAMCQFGCGRRTKQGFKTCCRACGRTHGGGDHDADCSGGASGGGSHPSSPKPMAASPRPMATSPRPSQEAVVMCKFGCGKKAKSGVTRSGKPLDTCCRACAMSHGGGGHDPDCGHSEPIAG